MCMVVGALPQVRVTNSVRTTCIHLRAIRDNVANHPKELGKERVREEVEAEEAQAPSESLSKQLRRKREAIPPH